MGKEAIVKRKRNIKDRLDAIDDAVYKGAYDGIFNSKMKILVGMWEKGEAIEVSEFRGVESPNQPSYYKLEKQTERNHESLKEWHELYLKYPEKQYYLPIAEEKAKRWTDNLFKPKLPKPDTPKLPDDVFEIIYADPPWEYATEQHGKEEQETVLETHYPTMSLENICGLNIESISAENSVLFLWVTSPKLYEAKEVLDAWGFTYKASFVWDKIGHNVGHYNSVRHELLLIATKGSYLPDNKKLYDSVQSIEKTEHSQKPEEFRKIIDDIYREGKRIELFGRGKAPDRWVFWGIETKV